MILEIGLVIGGGAVMYFYHKTIVAKAKAAIATVVADAKSAASKVGADAKTVIADVEAKLKSVL